MYSSLVDFSIYGLLLLLLCQSSELNVSIIDQTAFQIKTIIIGAFQN